VPAFVGLLGPVLVAASPQGPGLAVRLVAAGRGDDGVTQLSQQFRQGDGDQPERGEVTVSGALPDGSDGEECVGEQAEGGPAVPGGPGGDLAAVQGGGLFGQLVIFLDLPAGDGHCDQLGQRDRVRAPAQVVADGAGVAVPAQQQHAVPVAVSVGGVVGLGRDHRPVVVLGSLGGRPGAHPLPGTGPDQPGGCPGGQLAAGGQPHHVVGTHRHDVAAAAGADGAAQLGTAVDLIAGDVGSADTAAVSAGQQFIGQLRFGGEHDLIGHAGQLAAFVIGGPAGRQVQGPVDQGMPGRGGIREGDSDLAQRDPAGSPAVLTGRAHTVGG
jgi:hypothetical protein